MNRDNKEVELPELEDRCEYCGTLETDHKHGNGYRCCGNCCAAHGAMTHSDRGEYAWVESIVTYKNELLESLKSSLLRERELQAQVDERNGWLAECYRQSGADPDGNEDWRLAPHAVQEVTRLRQESDEASLLEETFEERGKQLEEFSSRVAALEAEVTKLTKESVKDFNDCEDQLTEFQTKVAVMEGLLREYWLECCREDTRCDLCNRADAAFTPAFPPKENSNAE